METGAVTLSVPQDIQAHAYDYPAHFFAPRTWSIERPLPQPQRIAEAVRLLAQHAQRPVIIAGGGVHYAEAWSALQTFAENVWYPCRRDVCRQGRFAATIHFC